MERRRRDDRSQLLPYVPLIFGTIVLSGAMLLFGILIGWLIWG
jgi:hypothetical protein